MPDKPKIAFYWCAGCGGCEESVIDLAGGLLNLSEKADIVFWPVALDARYRDLQAFDDGELDAAFINGALRLEAHVQMVQLLRRKARLVIAHGSCAHMGGVIGLANLHTTRQLLEFSYRQVPTLLDPYGPFPGAGNKTQPLSNLLPEVLPLESKIEVDAIIPGCPPPPETMDRAINDIVCGHPPEKGAVFAHRKALCQQCPRLDSKPEKIAISRFKRLYETHWDPDVCFLPQGLICLGPVTRGGCEARCIQANMPCRGCFGPTEKVKDFGAGAMALTASIMAGTAEPDLMQTVDSIPDPAGLFYRYALATSFLGKRRIP
jgi:F420-non-reducing hydrogenase small subunit